MAGTAQRDDSLIAGSLSTGTRSATTSHIEETSQASTTENPCCPEAPCTATPCAVGSCSQTESPGANAAITASLEMSMPCTGWLMLRDMLLLSVCLVLLVLFVLSPPIARGLKKLPSRDLEIALCIGAAGGLFILIGIVVGVLGALMNIAAHRLDVIVQRRRLARQGLGS